MTNSSPDSPAPIVPRSPAYPHTRLIKGGLARLDEELAARRDALGVLRLDAQIAEGARQSAEDEARQIREQARLDAEAIRSSAFERGFLEGQATLESFCDSLAATCNAAIDDVTSQVPRLALLIARKILRIELANRPRALLGIVRRALRRARLFREVRVTVNPADRPIVSEAAKALSQVLVHAREFELRSDPAMPRFGVRLETDRGTLDATLETQLDRAAERFARVLRDKSNEMPPAGATELAAATSDS